MTDDSTMTQELTLLATLPCTDHILQLSGFADRASWAVVHNSRTQKSSPYT